MQGEVAPDHCVGIVGLGAMGQGIAQVSTMGGMRTLLFDAKEGAAEAGRQQIVKRLERLVEKGQLAVADCAAMAGRLEVVGAIAGLAPCDSVIEAVIENIEVKIKVFTELEAVVRDDALLATNTSSIPIGAIARHCRQPGRIAGMHFFNPVPLMKLVEIIKGPDTDQAVCDRLAALGRRMTRTPVQVKDAPGFLVNFGGRAFTTEALRMQHEGVASPSQIDAILRDCCGFRMGPFELMDLTGIDVNFPVSIIVYEGYMDDPRIATSPQHKLLYEAGRFGRKTRRGHYVYDEAGKRCDPDDADYAPAGAAATSVVLAEASPELSALAETLGLRVLAADDGKSPLLGYPVGEDATSFAVRCGCDARRLVALDLSAGTDKRLTLMTAPGADPAVGDAVAAAVVASGRRATVIHDSPGFVAQRMRAFIANLGCYMAQIGLAVPAEIDLALKLGLNYPLGPLEMAGDLGLATTLRIMEQLQAITGEDRYRPSLWLRRRALLGLAADTPS
ncbi:3-hydroxyacyl-CoA dehydrogenase [Tistlia consotensis]|uniref:3-hydroxyacyl-CoA dehydrogenase n=1 Tax=Tistlia consotensis USBA 355 TaxID=560819 RepID=A0A1Y6C192_9PROT|nr:3-hydroxyacyl-CoA dehydrogenase [Tistlia consotensis]SMF30335.1 3-hydroxyacyl-CoA dehydrogenase [Tistlia consotensis USBA 355]SNR90165.1 3-hydroxyacyl-CoA dehydrogenase [Tistlia consotensis]